MKAITLWQPWASAIATGAKCIETRSWKTNYRGELIIHASKRRNMAELLHYTQSNNWTGALSPLGASMKDGRPLDKLLPFGAAVAVCEIVDCKKTEDFDREELDRQKRHNYGEPSWCEREMGNFSPGRYGWVLSNVRPLVVPVQCPGLQRIWSVPEEFEQLIRTQLHITA